MLEKTTKVIVALGKIAFHAFCHFCNVKGLSLVIIRFTPRIMIKSLINLFTFLHWFCQQELYIFEYMA